MVGGNKHGELGSDARLWRKTPSTIPTLGLIAAAAALIVIGSYAHVSAPATEPISPVDWALKLARSSEQEGAYACTMRYWPNVTGTVSCQQDCD